MTLIKYSLYLLLLCSLFSCASGIKVSSKYCSGDGIWADKYLNSDKVVKEYEMAIGIEEIFIKDILEENGHDCRSITNLSVGVERTTLDAFLGIIPGLSSQTIVIKFDDRVKY